MGIFDKLKNVFFEEEEVEVDETQEFKERVPVAKKIDVAETKKKEETKEEKSSNRLELDNNKEEIKEEKDFKFPMGFDDKDFEVEKTIEIFGPIKEKTEPEIEPEVEIEPEPIPEVVSDEPPVERFVEKEKSYEESYNEPIRERVYKEESRESYHKLYEGKEKSEEKSSGFTPSPIISPIYGILNKNYKKEQIVTKSELRQVELVQQKDELDMVREKAYGDLASEISASIDEDIIDIEDDKPKEKEDLLYDLNDEEPTVKTVTVGDAEEYFNDLGLEYNVDYKVEKEEPKEVIEEKPKVSRVEKLKGEEKEDDKNLFDLIDAMYEDEEKE